ncbi:D-2-hydroxyacid dehydrogenase family protein [Mycolicibacterium komossense]|uniref:D-2-hydroxyacid dehydrogenase family protein n=1 Tax=Mycolicibacterium komossense TaxID=1779 RepID=A0ABT3C7Y9_9MYCO|nr:D-2-hydroxyacid dehydrogenase family protein [Mycolicibacterium komossense]MCV7225573.1 D-2-hydroxyacid dehydrogenase family protein [Mycolicibacterium komossense]
MKVAVLDDYQNVALQMADWSPVARRAEITVFTDHLADPDDLVERLAPFDVVAVMRERTPLPRDILQRLPQLKMIASTGPFNASIDMAAAEEFGIHVGTTGGSVAATIELTWALILAGARSLVAESRSVRDGGWQTTVGQELSGKVLGVLGLGRIGARVAPIGTAFGMDVIAWSQNLTPEAAEKAGVRYVSRDALFATSDVLTIHLKLSDRSRGLIGPAELAAMKPTAMLVNTSRGPIVKEAALVDALQNRQIAGAALDVFDTEPLPVGHPLRTLDNVLATPHIGYVADRPYRIFFGDTVAAISDWLDREDTRGS